LNENSLTAVLYLSTMCLNFFVWTTTGEAWHLTESIWRNTDCSQ